MDLIYIYNNAVTIVMLGCAIYLLLLWFYKSSIVSFSDPFNLQLLLVSSYLSGAVMLVVTTKVNETYITALSLIFFFLISGALTLKIRQKSIGSPKLIATKRVQLFFSAAIVLILIINIIINYFFGFIPLFHGTESRASAGQVPIPSLMVASPVIWSVSLYLAFISNYNRIRCINRIGILIGLLTVILGGGKGAIFSILAIFFTKDYILMLNLRSEEDSIAIAQLQKKIKKNRITGSIFGITLVLAFPFYLLAVGAGKDLPSAIIGIMVRIYGGFDGLIFLSQSNIDHNEIDKLNLLHMYFYPFFKRFSEIPDFKTAGSYVIYLITGDYMQATTTLYPNSNLVIEALLSFNNIFSICIFIGLISAFVFFVRKTVIAKKRWKMYDVFLLSFMVTSPISVLLDGAYFITLFYEQLFVYLTLNFMVNFACFANRSTLKFSFF